MEVALARVDAAPLPVGYDCAGGAVERTRPLPPVGHMVECGRAADCAVLEDASLEGDGAIAHRARYRFTIGERHPPIQSFELAQHRVSCCPPGCGVGLDHVQSLQRGLERIGPAPEQRHVEVGPVQEVELELASSLAVSQHSSYRTMRIPSVGKATDEMAHPALVSLKLYVEVDIMRFDCAAGERTENV